MADPDITLRVISWKAAKAAGLKHYYTGLECKSGHVARRQVSNMSCVLCLARSRIAFYWRNRDQEIAKVKADYRINRAARRKRANEYDAAHPLKKKVRFRAWYVSNRAAYLAKKAADRIAAPEVFKARYKRWAVANHEAVIANARQRDVRKKGAEGKHTGAEIKALFKRQNGRCAYCKTSLRVGYHADHIQPIAKGGSNWIINIQLTCGDCNLRKSAKDPVAWAREIGLLL